MKSWVILGASSFYGANFAQALERKGEHVTSLSRPQWKLGAKLPVGSFDYIINFVSLNRVPESWQTPGKYIYTNVELTTRLLEQLCKFEFGRFIHVSTPEVYGSSDDWVREDRVFNPSTPYAITRAAGDRMVMAYNRVWGLPAVITRTANIYGLGQQPYRLIPKALQAKKEGKSFPLEGGGKSRRSFIHVRDACEGTYIAATKGEPGVYHISTQELTTVREIVEKLGVAWKEAPERPGNDHCYALDSTRLRSLGWQETVSFEEGLRQCESENVK